MSINTLTHNPIFYFTILFLVAISCTPSDEYNIVSQEEIVTEPIVSTIPCNGDSAFLKLLTYRNNDSIPFVAQPNVPSGYPVFISIGDTCPVIPTQHYMFEGEIKKICLSPDDKYIYWEAYWEYPFPIHETEGWPVQFAIFSDTLCTNQIWPTGSYPVSFWPLEDYGSLRATLLCKELR